MLNTVNQFIHSSGNLEDISSALVGSVEKAQKAGTGMIMGIINKGVVPTMLVILLVLMLYFIAAFAYSKRRREGDGASQNIIGLGICFVAFLLIAAYGTVFGGLISIITGA